MVYVVYEKACGGVHYLAVHGDCFFAACNYCFAGGVECVAALFGVPFVLVQILKILWVNHCVFVLG